MEKNFILFVVLSAAILFTWNLAYGPKLDQASPQTKNQLTPSASTAPKEAQGDTSVMTAAPVSAAAPSSAAAPDKPAKTVTVSNGAVEAVFSDKGARLVSWKLTKFDEVKGKKGYVQLIPEDGDGAGDDLGYGALHVAGLDMGTRTWELLTPKPEKQGEQWRVAFATPYEGKGFKLRVIKEFLFSADDYVAELNVAVENPGTVAVQKIEMELTWGPGIGHTLDSREYDYGDQFLSGALAQTEDEKVFEKPDDTNETLAYDNPKWVAIRNQYFVAALIPEQGWTQGEIKRVYRVFPGASGKEQMMAVGLKSDSFLVKPGERYELKTRILGSHQEYSYLKSFNNNLQGVVQFTPWRPFRILDPLAIAMLYILKWFHGLFHNWGVALILLTLVVKGAMFYPTMKGMVSMRKMSAKMARMQPRLETIKKMYKDDPSKLNQEMMKLYKEEGVNPLGGCLPLLVQMPIFFALYGTLLGSFELRGADFFWIWTDLSQPEKWPVMAILMGSTMYLQQKMSPQPSAQVNPEQAKMQKMMMNIMPLMLTAFAIFGGWPSGLLLYWAASNIFSIVQQLVVNKKYPVEGPPAAPAVVPQA